ncbi:hypothetical protein [Streptomyces platensis]|uniref:hypothetical protein n=1 Tax=Streptomyces platensis TaxID=58346 RepID=UPI0037A575EC
MDKKGMRRLCADLLRGLERRDTGTPSGLFTALCVGMSRRHDRLVTHRLVRFPTGTASGLWVATATRHFVLCEQDTAPEHQLVILGHEFWHLETHKGTAEVAEAVAAAQLLAQDVSPTTVEHIARRSTVHSHDQAEEAACEYFGSLLASRAWPLLASAATGDAMPSSGLAQRIESSFDPRGPVR